MVSKDKQDPKGWEARVWGQKQKVRAKCYWNIHSSVGHIRGGGVGQMEGPDDKCPQFIGNQGVTEM